MLPRVFALFKNGIPATHNVYQCWHGFSQRGHLVVPFADPALSDAPIERGDLVVGGIGVVRAALARLGVAAPAPLDYPAALRPLLRRRVWATTMGVLRHEEPFPLFVKPIVATKLFTGLAVRSRADLLRVAHVDDAVDVWASEVCTFASEWRVYVLRGEVLGVGHYQGDPLRFPNPGAVRALLDAYASTAPAAFALDVGVLENGGTDLVEVNDAYALGNYGLPSTLYAQMIEARWAELMEPASRRAE